MIIKLSWIEKRYPVDNNDAAKFCQLILNQIANLKSDKYSAELIKIGCKKRSPAGPYHKK